MNPADVAIATIITISVVIGLVRGLVVEVLSLGIWVAAVVLAMMLGESIAGLFADSIALPSARYALGYAIVFVGTLLLGAIVVYVMKKIVAGTGLTGTDRLLGMVFGLVRGAIVVIVLVLLLGLTPLTRDAWWHESRALPTFQALAQSMLRWLPEPVANYFEYASLGGKVEEAVFGSPSDGEPADAEAPPRGGEGGTKDDAGGDAEASKRES